MKAKSKKSGPQPGGRAGGSSAPETRHAAKSAKASSAATSHPWLPYLLAALVAAALTVWAYGPAMYGPFLFDDTYLKFALPGADSPLSDWVQGVRPLLMASYWLSARMAGDTTYAYHFGNVLIHLAAGGLIGLIVRRLLEWAGVGDPKRTWMAAFAGALYLLHPLNSEAVAYLAGRSESLSTALALAAYAVFLYPQTAAVSWGAPAAVFLLFGAALLTKEQTLVLPALLLLTDFWWNPASPEKAFSFQGIRANWRLYVPLGLAAAGGLYLFRNLIVAGGSAGFGLKDFTWYQYFFTQCRALFVYALEFVCPAWLNVDWHFPISHSLIEHGAIFGLVAWLALVAAAWFLRRRFRLAAFGLLVYLVMMAPTSSILPIADAVAERRAYFSMLGLLLILLELLLRARLAPRTLGAVCALVLVAAATVTHARAALYGDEVALWTDSVEKTPNNYRGHFHLAQAYMDENRCDLAVREFQRAAAIGAPDYGLLVDWGLAYDCLNRPEQAIEKLRQAAAIDRSAHVYTQIAKVFAERNEFPQALDALRTAEQIDPRFAVTYVYRGKVRLKLGQPQVAVEDFRTALRLDPQNQDAIEALGMAERSLRGRP
ncbi:MAG: tetratricopeptide repeat protein [Bryobacteraceae bacterium]